ADAEGVEFWANALASGTSKGALLAQFTAAALSDPNSDDAQTLNAKVNVANAITAKFNNFNADVTADQKKAALNELKATMTEVVAGSTTEDFQERIDTFAGNYQNRVAQVFTTKDDDQLDASEATASTVFSGNVNLIDPAKGTIQSGDSVTGNSNYTDTLRVSVTSDSANKDFSLDSNLPTSVSSIEKLIITAGAANVSGTLNGTNYAESATITSTGDVDLKIGGVQKELKVTAGDKKEAAITVESGSLDNYTGSAAKDTINVKTGNVKTIDTGAGKDVVTIAAGANIKNEGSIKLGAGDDELTIGATLKLDKDTLNKISLDGGEGSKDKLTISTDITAVNSITGFETITATASAKISADAANSLTSSTKLSNNSVLAIDMNGKNSLNLKNLGVNKAADNTAGTAAVAIENVAKGEITLTSTANNAIVETITLAKTEDGKTGPVTIKGIGAALLENESKKAGSNGDKLAIAETTIGGNPNKLKASVAAGETQTLTANNLHYVNTKISSVDDLANKGTVLGLGLTLTTGKTLVALNNSAQNKSYIYEITGSATGLTRDNITLKAIVDNAINKYDQVSGNTIEFVAGVERDVASGGNTSGKVLAYSGDTIDLSTGTYTVSGNTQETFTPNTQKLIITGINGNLAVSSGSNTIDAFVKTADGKVTKGTGADNATINIHLGGTETAAGAKSNTDDSFTVTAANISADSDKIAEVRTTGELTLANDQAATLGNGYKLDLGNVNATIKFTSVSGSTNAVDYSGLFSNIASGDTINSTLASGVTKITLTNAKEEVKLDASSSKVEVINFNKDGSGKDTIKLSAQLVNLTNTTTLDASTGPATLSAGKLNILDLSSGSTVAKDLTFNNIFGSSGSGKISTTTSSSGDKAVIAVKGSDGKYLIGTVNAGADSSVTTGEVKLVAVVDSATISHTDIVNPA
ncbi:beta strand repeat-containing protein, partial [Campylobacter magnus]|uniref:beta strand repeat-containing protein n=1 Tax=Campylobacter magnus TaxID=3026462 RepID=UPI0026DEA67A